MSRLRPHYPDLVVVRVSYFPMDLAVSYGPNSRLTSPVFGVYFVGVNLLMRRASRWLAALTETAVLCQIPVSPVTSGKNHYKNGEQVKKVLLLLAQGFETYEAAVFIDVIGWNLIDGDHSTKLYSCGFTKVVASSFDQKVVVDYLIDEIDVEDFDALAIPGGFEEFGFYQEAYDEKFLAVIRAFKKKNKIIASICVAALTLGKSGVLQGRKGTTYNKKAARQEALRSFGVDVINRPVVIDDTMITCWNPSTAIDVAFILLELLTSKQNTDHIKNIMGFEEKIK